jgi:uncharacterized protein (UPF0332 family)
MAPSHDNNLAGIGSKRRAELLLYSGMMDYNLDMEADARRRQNIAQYLARARQALDTGRLVMAHQDYAAAVNRAYYAIFYAANALLVTKGLERSKHSGVIAAFRRHFVKTGTVAPEFSTFYGEAMDERHTGDYELAPLDHTTALRNLDHATRFVERYRRSVA